MDIKNIIKNKDIIHSIQKKFNHIDKVINREKYKLTSITKLEKIKHYFSQSVYNITLISAIVGSIIIPAFVLKFFPLFSNNDYNTFLVFTSMFVGILLVSVIRTFFENRSIKKFLLNKSDFFKIIFKKTKTYETSKLKNKILEDEYKYFTKEEIDFLSKDENIQFLDCDNQKMSKLLFDYFKEKKIKEEEKNSIFKMINELRIDIDKEKLELIFQNNKINKQVFINKNTLIKNI
jgi:hypothetical protein